MLECLLYEYLTNDLYPEYINNCYDLIIKRQHKWVKHLNRDFTSVSIVNTLVSLLMVFNKCMQLCHPQPFSQYRMFLPPKKQKRKKDCCLHPRTFPLLPFIFTDLVTITIGVILPVVKLHTKALRVWPSLSLAYNKDTLIEICMWQSSQKKKKSGENRKSKFRNHWFPCSSVSKESACNVGREDPLEKEMATHSSYFCLENPMDRGAWQPTVRGVTRVRHNLAAKPPPHTHQKS